MPGGGPDVAGTQAERPPAIASIKPIRLLNPIDPAPCPAWPGALDGIRIIVSPLLIWAVEQPVPERIMNQMRLWIKYLLAGLRFGRQDSRPVEQSARLFEVGRVDHLPVQRQHASARVRIER